MTKLYSLRNGFLAAAVAVSGGLFAQEPPLDAVLCNVNADYEDVTDLVPSMYVFAYDGGIGDIGDGGGDMYDGGNRLNTNFATNIPYSDDAIMASASFGTTGEYFTRHLPGLFVMVADLDAVTDFYITGNNGADGSGTADEHVFSTTVLGTNYDVFVKRVHSAFDPSINHMMIIPEDASVSHTWATNTNDDQHNILNLGSTDRIYYLLYSSSGGGFIDNATTESIADAFLNMALPVGAVEANASATELCEGDTLLLYGSGGASGYDWNLGVTDSVEFVPSVGTYEYIVDDATGSACIAEDTVTVVVNAQPAATLSTDDELIAGMGSVYLTITGGAFPLTFDWDNDGTGDFDDDQNLLNVPAGTYTVTIMAPGGCTYTDSATINSQVGIEDESLSFEAYPNPTNGNFVIELDGEFGYTLYNLVGERVFSGYAVNKEVMDMVELPAGTYFVNLTQGDSEQTIKVVKQ
ncbi:MAG: T9SS type A sorting domain-containing protein [Flavobacteriales bacterium]|jgi:hypothetical protein|nr:T9SS type A sorting domain-containing protein [Flavobacteriales bacterium]